VPIETTLVSVTALSLKDNYDNPKVNAFYVLKGTPQGRAAGRWASERVL